MSLADLAAPPQPDTFYLACSTSVPGKTFAVLSYSVSHNEADVALHLEQERYHDDAGAPVALACSWDQASNDTSTFLVATLSDNSLRTVRFWPRKLVPRCYDHLEYGNTNTAVDIAAPPWGTGSWAAVVGTHDLGSSADVLVYRRDMDYSWAWSQVASMPQGNKHKNVKDGGCLAYDRVDGAPYVYALKGNNTYEFYRYGLGQNALSWEARESIPAIGRSGNKKAVKKGAALAAEPEGGKLYAVKGNNTREFWAYDPAARVWTQKADVPRGFVGKYVKEGSGLLAVPVSGAVCVYLLKGSGTNEFFRYHIEDDFWETMASAPTGLSGKTFKNGSALTYDYTLCGDIYALKGSYNEFFAYSILENTWTTKAPLPKQAPGSAKKTKAKDGAGLAYHMGHVFALKGGNTNEFWAYDPNWNLWTFEAPVPTVLKKVKGGGALVSVLPVNPNALYALRGNNTLEFWRCHETANPSSPETDNPSSPGANEVLVAAGENAATPRWSPEGAWVAYVKPDAYGHDQVYKAPVGGGSETQLTSSGNFASPVWSPSGGWIAAEYRLADDSNAQLALIPDSGGSVTVLTSSSGDHCTPEWKLDGSGVYFARDDDTGYSQLYFVPATGGSEQALTTSSYDHTLPKPLSATEVICLRDDDNGFSQVYRVDPNTGQEVALTSSACDHENLTVAPGQRLIACEEVTEDGNSRIIEFSADGGSENALTGSSYSYENPSFDYDALKLYCLKRTGTGSAVCVIDGITGALTELTDDDADRESPSCGIILTDTGSFASAVYVRGDSIYRTTGISIPGCPALLDTPATPEQGARRLVRMSGDGAMYACGNSFGKVKYARVEDGAWQFWRTIDYGVAGSIASGPAGKPWIAYRKADTLKCGLIDASGDLKRLTLYAAPSSQHLDPPSLAVFQSGGGRAGNVVFPCYDTVSTNSMILFAQFDTSGSVVLDTINFNSGKLSDSSACLVVGATDTIAACYNSGDSVYMKKLVFSPTSMTRPNAWSVASLVDSGVVVSTRHAAAEKVGSRLWVTVSQKRLRNDTTVWAIKQVSCSLLTATVVWEGLATVSAEDIALKDYPSISARQVVAWAESSGTHWVIKASVDDSVLTLTGDTSCKCVSILADTAVQTTPSTSTTGIYYTWLQKLAGDTWAAKYASKQVLTSNAEANVTRYNQGRKLLLSTDDTLSSVYRTTAGSIFYSKKKDGVEGWTSSLLRSTGQFPCLTEDYLNRTWVAEQDVSSAPPSRVIRCQNRAAGSSTWHDFQVYSVSSDGQANAWIGPPAIVACLNDSSDTDKSAAYIVFTVYTSIPVKSTIVMAKVDTLGVVYVDTLHYVTTYADSFPSIAAYPVSGPGYGLKVAWQFGTEVYVKKISNMEHPEFLTKRTWSSNYNLSNTAAKSKHPLIAADADTVLVAWVEGDSGAIVTKGQGPGSAYDSWGGVASVSACPDTVCDNPTIALGDSIIVAYHKKLSATNYDIIARVNFHSNLNLSNSTTTSRYPHCAFHFHNDSFPVISTVWTEVLSANYAEVAYKRWQLGLDGGGGIQDYSIFNPNIKPALYAPAPNPFNHSSSIRFATNIKGLTRVSIIDITGRRVRNLLSTVVKPGVYNLTWNARDDRERRLAGGVYFVRLLTPNYHETRKVIMTQ